MKQKVFYYNNTNKALMMSVDNFSVNNTVTLEPCELGEFEIDVKEGQGVFVKLWGSYGFISTMPLNSGISTIRPSSQKDK